MKPLLEYYTAIDDKYQITDDDKCNIPPSAAPIKLPVLNPSFTFHENSWLDHASALLRKDKLDERWGD